METERLFISDAQKKILVEFYERGMISTKKELTDIHVECAKAVGLSETQVKNWISNYKASIKQLSWQQPMKKKSSVLIRKRSGFNAFAKEERGEGSSADKKQRFSELGSKWGQLAPEQKEIYKARAVELNSSSPVESLSDPQRSKRIITNMMKEVSELDSVEEVECLVICLENDRLYHGPTRLAHNFLSTYPHFINDFARSCKNASFSHKKEISQKMIQNLFNQKFNVANALDSFPKKPSFYGQSQRLKLWECKDKFSFVFQPPCLETPNGEPTPSTTFAPSTFSLSLNSSNQLSNTIPTTCTPAAPVNKPNSLPQSISSTLVSPIITNNISTPVSVSTSSTLTIPSTTTQPRTTSTSLLPEVIPTTLHPVQLTLNKTPPIPTSTLSTCNTPTQNITTSNGIVFHLKEGTAFGLMDDSKCTRATGKLVARTVLHSRPVRSDCLVVEVDTLSDECDMRPPVPVAFEEDEPIQIGAFYAWPISKLSPIST